MGRLCLCARKRWERGDASPRGTRRAGEVNHVIRERAAVAESDTRHHNRRHSRVTPKWRGAFVALLVLASTASPVFAQNYSFDARRIALGGAAGTPNIAAKLVERQRRYTSILIPVGLIKVLSNVRVFYPNREDFDFSRAVEFASSPLHHVFGRSDDFSRRELFADIFHARVDPDLNAYRGFDVSPSTSVEELLSLHWGKTFMVHEDDRSFQGFYVGAGPYLATQAYADFDAELVRILNASSNRYVPAATLGVGGGETDQLAIAIVGGYRARFPLFAQDGPDAARNGLYVAVNYSYLLGLRYDDFNARLQLETDSAGLVSPNPQASPFTFDWHKSTSGRGQAVDLGVAAIVNRWDFGFGVGGIANQITWSRIHRHNFALVSLFDGNEFIHLRPPVTSEKRRLELPVTYTGNVSYHRDQWSLFTEYSRGYEDDNLLGGLEYRLGKVELRGAGRLSQGDWFPSGGAGFNITRNFGVDAAVFGTKTFLEPEAHVGLAISFRLEKRQDP
jgi:hypothetical protein